MEHRFLNVILGGCYTLMHEAVHVLCSFHSAVLSKPSEKEEEKMASSLHAVHGHNLDLFERSVGHTVPVS